MKPGKPPIDARVRYRLGLPTISRKAREKEETSHGNKRGLLQGTENP